MSRRGGPDQAEVARREARIREEFRTLVMRLLEDDSLSAETQGRMAAELGHWQEMALLRLHTDPVPEAGDSDAYYRAWARRNLKAVGTAPAGAGDAGPPAYAEWEDFLAGTTEAERMAWCQMKAKKVNRTAPPDDRLTAKVVWSVLLRARGRCVYCASLAVERRPSTRRGTPSYWEAVGRRVGSLEHIRPRMYGGTNAARNLAWCCLWCNTWETARIPGATDHGGLPASTR